MGRGKAWENNFLNRLDIILSVEAPAKPKTVDKVTRVCGNRLSLVVSIAKSLV